MKRFFATLAHKDWLVAFLVTAASLAFYGSYIVNKPTGLHASDLIITLSSQLGVFNSPGYPLLSLLYWLFISGSSSFFTTAYSAHILTAIFSSLSLGIMYLTLSKVYSYSKFNNRFVVISPEFEKVLYCSLPIIFIGLSKLYWRYSLFAERYTFSVLLVTICLYFVIKFITTKAPPHFLNLLALGLVLGLGISHQWIFVPFTVLSVFILRDSLRQYKLDKLIISLGLLVAGSFLPYFLMFSSLSRAVEYSNIFVPTVQGLTEYVLQAYIGDSYGLSADINVILQRINLEFIISNIWQIVQVLGQSLGWFVVLLLFGSLLYQAPPQKKNIFRTTVFLFLGLTLTLGIVFSWVPNLENFPEIIPQALVLYPFLGLLIYFSLYELISRFGGAAKVLSNKTYSQYGLLLILLLSISYNYYYNAKTVPLQGKIVSDAVAKSILDTTDSSGLLACFTYNTCYSLIYQQKINNLNPSITILPFYFLPETIVLNEPNLQGFNYTGFPYVMYDIITWNIDLRPVYSVDMFEDYFNLFGIDSGFLSYIPYGYYSQVSNSIPDKYPEFDMSLSEKFLDVNVDAWDLALLKEKFAMAKRHLFNTSIYMKSGLRNTAVDEVNIATSLGYDLNNQLSEQIAFLRSKLESLPPSEYYELGYEADSVSELLEDVDTLVENQRINKALQISKGAVTSDPRSIQARLKYAQLLEMAEASSQAIVEYNNVLSLDEENETALSRLEYQNNL